MSDDRNKINDDKPAASDGVCWIINKRYFEGNIYDIFSLNQNLKKN